MALPFDPREAFIALPMRVFGPNGELILRFLLDTGSTISLLGWDAAMRLGYEPDDLSNRIQTITASSLEVSHRIVIEKIEALGQERLYHSMLCRPLPSILDIDGVLGLDFFQGHKLTIDFRIGLITLE